MIELPDFSPLRTTASASPPLKAALDRFDHVLAVVPSARTPALARLPHGRQLHALLGRAKRNGDDFASTRLPNPRATGGQYYLVVNGSLALGTASYSAWSTVFVPATDAPLAFTSGPRGLEALLLQFARQ